MMRKSLLLVIFIGVKSFSLEAQITDLPIFNEPLRKGVYKTFDEFKFNRPSIVKPIVVDFALRTSKNWEQSIKFIPKYEESKRKVKKAWGFCDGKKVFVFHQWEFFEVSLDSSEISFDGYGIYNSTGAVSAGVIGGAVGGALYISIAIAHAKNQRINYLINPTTGKISDPMAANAESTLEFSVSDSTKLIIYRRGTKQLDQPMSLLLKDSINIELLPNTVMEFEECTSNIPIRLCYGESFDQCVEISMIKRSVKYLECSLTAKRREFSVEEMKIEHGVYNSKQAKYLQEKREQKLNRKD